ncbi:MAG: hypothetical protein R3184_13880, partial [Aurantimonas coralicida]|nr:hypothetical protein [Aurantimonas coralicida]
LVEKLGMRRLSHGALIGFLSLAALHLVVAYAMGGAAPLWFFVPIMTLNFCLFGFIGTNFNALAKDPHAHVAGTASSLLGFMQTFGGGLFGAAIGYFYDGTVLPMLVGFIILSVSSLICVVLAEGRLFDAKYDTPATGTAPTSTGAEKQLPRASGQSRAPAGALAYRGSRPSRAAVQTLASQAAMTTPSLSRGV